MDYLSDLRVIRAIAQVAFVIVIVFTVAYLWNSVYTQLVAINATPSFDFLGRRAGFGINQSPDWYSSNSSYQDAFLVGVVNTLQVVWIGLVLATVMGVLLGIFLLSQNWLVRNISRIYVEILRNTPLLVQLIFWYFVFWLGLPSENISFPNESVMIVALRYFPYLVAIIGALIYTSRFTAPNRFFNGILSGFVLAELAFWLAGDSYLVIVGLGILGAVALLMAKRESTLPKGYDGLVQGVGVMLIVQLVGHLILDGLGAAGILENTRIVYGEVLPLLVIGPNLFAMPYFAFARNINFIIFAVLTVIGIIIALGLYNHWGGVIERTGANIPRILYAGTIILVFVTAGWFLGSNPVSEESSALFDVSIAELRSLDILEEQQIALFEAEQPVIIQAPQLNRFGSRVEIGNSFSPNYVALLVGLVVYTSAFIGEIVRAGIQAVPWGQVEAARALGLSTPQTLRMIVLPQALRVIIPPLGNQYLNLSKNSSLATAIAFSDTYQVGQTIMNQSGQSITGFFLILIVYLTLSLIISFIMNLINSRFQLVTR
jgi:His/Glu/Gln/Arg/opine family amino acid ABC transporter permease subunit